MGEVKWENMNGFFDGISIEEGWTEGSVFFKAISNNLRYLRKTLTCSRLI